MASKMSASAAATLWGDLAQNLIDFEKNLTKIVEYKAWEPLGYSSFAEAWKEKMSGVKLATHMAKATVVYQLLEEGATPVEIAGLGIVGDRAARTLQTQKEKGVPADKAVIVRSYERSSTNRAPYRVMVEIDEDTRRSWESLCQDQNTNLQIEAKKALDIHFEKMLRKSRRAK